MTKPSLPGLTRQSITLRQRLRETMDARVKPAHDGRLGRRKVIALLGGVAAAWPLATHAQQPAMPVIGFLSGAALQTAVPHRITAFLEGLSEAGYIENRNVMVEYRWAGGQLDRLPALAADLVGRHVAVIVSQSDLATFAAKKATTTIPIVFITGGDAVRIGFVESLNRPGGNMTGTTFLNADLGPKRLGLLHEFVPKTAAIAVLLDGNFEDAVSQLAGVQAAARTLRREIIVVKTRTAADIDTAFATLLQQGAGGLLLVGGNFFTTRREQIVALAAHHAIPAIYLNRDYAEAGGLVSYGNSPDDTFRQAGAYAGRILKGEKPSDLPVVQPTRWELVINLKTAKALSLTIPPGVLAIADEVIE